MRSLQVRRSCGALGSVVERGSLPREAIMVLRRHLEEETGGKRTLPGDSRELSGEPFE